jgi:hypothetical protein
MSTDRIHAETVRSVCLDYVQFYARTNLPSGCIEQATKADGFIEHEMQHLVFMLRTAVLGEDGGDEVSDWVEVLLPIRPRWIPKWAWKRIPTRAARWELRAQPKWTYPYSEFLVPELGPRVEIAVNGGLTSGDGEWRE